MNPQPTRWTLEGQGQRLDRFLAQCYPESSRSALQRWIKDQRVQVQRSGRPVSSLKASFKLKPGDQLSVTAPEPGPAPGVLKAEELDLDLLYQDAHILVVNKPPDLIVHPGAGAPDGTLVNALLAVDPHLPKAGGDERPGIVHRLDKDTSGVIIVARTESAHRYLSEQFKERHTEKHYLALVVGEPASEGLVDKPIGRHVKDRKRMAVRYDHGREARSFYKVQEYFGHMAALMRIRIETGRTHQIRVHMASIGHSVLADATYGSSKRELRAFEKIMGRQALHAASLKIRHPESHQWMCFEAPVPEDMAKTMEALRKHLKTVKDA